MTTTTYAYVCERCDEPVALTSEQYASLPEGKWGRIVRCAAHGGRPDAPLDANPEAVTKRKPERKRIEVPKADGLNLKPDERDDYGVTVTIREQDSREVDVVVASGPVTKALSDACATIDARAGDWRIVTISTPGTIFRDLQGMRDTEIRSVEALMVGKVGRADLLEARVIVKVVAD